MKLYFACTITGGRDFETVYQVLVHALVGDGHEVPTAHLAESSVAALEAVVDAREVYARDVEWIRSSDALIAETSAPSHGVGYEIGYALALGKPVLALHQRDRKVSKMITGNPDPNLSVRAYENPDDALKHLREFLLEIRSGVRIFPTQKDK